ncbi:MAG: phosphotransferase [Propionibacteriaceae bacterium]
MTSGTSSASPDAVPADIAARVRDQYEINLAASVRLTGGTDDHAAVWRVVDDQGRDYVLKLSRGALTAGLVAAAQPSLAGVPGIAPPVSSRSRGLWLSLPGAQLAVFPWIDGRGGTDGPLSLESWHHFGRLMAALHGVTEVVDLGAPLPEETFHPVAAARVQRLGRRIDRLAGGTLDDTTQQVVQEWVAAQEVIARVTDQAVALGQHLAQHPSPRVLTHGDCHLFNVVVSADDQVWLLDWVDAALAPPERDLIFFTGGIFADAQLTAAEQQAFFDGYGPAELDPSRLAYYRSVRALEDVEWAERALDRHRPDDERVQALGFFRGVLAPHGMVEQALATLVA